MKINPLTDKECSDFVSRISLGRLGCALDNQPYVLPIYFAHDGDNIYGLATFGQKIEWMRANPKVCVQVDEIRSEGRWTSVILNGQYQELPEPEFAEERARARQLLEKRHRWWLNAMGERLMKSSDHLVEPLFFRVKIDSMSGLRAGDDGE
ncbi:MAG TPA: pyridoxamine 5'-phosphate oxidase family protein [Terriglobales bacterium]|nr:pyridoxamine 5'-phosphate oxidase family protein [Terriglobales bacterium]